MNILILERFRDLSMTAATKAKQTQSTLTGIITAEGDVPEYLFMSARESLAEARNLIEMAEAHLAEAQL